MKRLSASLVLFGSWLCCGLGCTSTFEAKTIAAFTDALEDSDLEKLRATSSEEFQETVLRRDDALDSLKQIKFPTGEMKVVKIKDVDAETKQATVEVGEHKRKLIFTLTRDPETRHWLVDDIKIKKKKKPGQVDLTVQQQMDMLLSIREFMDAWTDRARDRVLASTTPSLAEHLGKLPNGCLAKLAKSVAGQAGKKSGFHPEVEGHKDAAFVRIQRKTGEILLSLRLVDKKWKADDVQVNSKHEKDNMPSLRKLTSVMIAAIAFYDAYNATDKEALKGICTKEFYHNGLSSADLSSVKLPEVAIRDGEFEANLQKTRAIVMVKHQSEMLQLSLLQDLPKDEAGEVVGNDAEDNMSMVPFLVQEATLCELGTKQEKRLSALFTAQSVMAIFSEALAERDLKTLQLTASQDFLNRVWSRLVPAQMQELPLDQIEHAAPHIEEIQFKGPITELTVTQGKQWLTYILRDQTGRLVVDDIEFPALDRPNSLKTTLDVMLPVYDFVRGLQSGQIPEIKKVASRDFGKAVWNQLEEMPNLPRSVAEQFRAPLAEMKVSTDRALVVLGDPRWGAKIFLSKEGEVYRVDDVMLIAGIESKDRTAMKQFLRGKMLQVASSKSGGKSGSERPASQVIQAVAEEPAEEIEPAAPDAGR